MKLVDNWKSSFKWHSVQAMGAVAALPAVWATLPHDLKSSIPDSVLPWVASAVMVAGIVGRLRDQNSAK